MSFLDEYKRLAESETDNNFPEQMEHDGLSESDREMYEEVLSKMRSDMNKANEEMKKNAKSWGDVCHATENGRIQNSTYALSEEMLKSRTSHEPKNQFVNEDGTTKRVSEAIGFYVDAYRCPNCGRMMYEANEKFVCGSCGHSEATAGRRIQFYFYDSSFAKTPFASEDNESMNAVFRRANMNNK